MQLQSLRVRMNAFANLCRLGRSEVKTRARSRIVSRNCSVSCRNEFDLAEVLDAMTDQFIAERRPPLDGQLAQLEELDRLRLRTVVARRAGLLHRLALQQDKVMLVFSRKKISYPSEMEPALRYIAAAGEFEVGSIPNLDVAQRLLLVHRLVREGFLIVVRQPPQDEC